jgi:HEAT repeat protein
VVLAGHAGDSETARGHLGDDDPNVRAAALRALERTDALTAAELGVGLRDQESRVRRSSAMICSRRTDMANELLEILTDADPMVVETAAFALGEHQPPAGAAARVTTALCEVVRTHDDALCREAAVAALGSLGDPAAVGAVLTACEDKATVRRRAVLALAAFDGPEVTRMLRAMTNDRDLQVRQAAEDLLAIELGEDT